MNLPMIFAANQRMDRGMEQTVSAFHGMPLDVFVARAMDQFLPSFFAALRASLFPAGAHLGGMWSFAVLAFVTMLLVLLPNKPEWILETERNSQKEFGILKKIASGSVILMFAGFVLYAYSLMGMATHELASFGRGILLFLPGFMIGLSQVWISALVTSVYCTAGLNALESKNRSFGNLFQEGLAVFPAMLAYSLTITVLVLALQIVTLPIFGLMDLNAFDTYEKLRTGWIEPVLRFIVAGIPLLIVAKRLNPHDIYSTQTRFLRNNVLPYIVFLCSGLIIFFMPTFLDRLIGIVVTPLTVPSYDIVLILRAIQTFLAALYMVAFLDWIRQTR